MRTLTVMHRWAGFVGGAKGICEAWEKYVSSESE